MGSDSERKKELDWTKRLEIIIGIAQGLKYLHKECGGEHCAQRYQGKQHLMRLDISAQNR